VLFFLLWALHKNVHSFLIHAACDGCFLRPKHVAAIGFVMIKVLCRRTASILLRVLQTQRDVTPQKGSCVFVDNLLLHQILGDCINLC
jgi:hypothetical protein